MTSPFSGSSVAVVTPMNDGGDIDAQAFAALLEWHIAEGTDSIVIAGTTGESPTLSVAEHQALIAQGVKIVRGRVPVIAGVGANSTQEAVALTRQALADGADAGLSVVPYYNKPTQEGLYRHFAAIAAASELPLLLYDVPGRCVVGLADDTIARLAAIPAIIGVKDAAGDGGRAESLRRLLPEPAADFLLISGDDKTAADYLLAGGDGVISVTANIAPAKMAAMIAAARAGDEQRARQLDADLQPFHDAQGIESNPIPVKAALRMLGKIAGGIRLPLTPLSTQFEDTVADALAATQRNPL